MVRLGFEGAVGHVQNLRVLAPPGLEPGLNFLAVPEQFVDALLRGAEQVKGLLPQ
jgi:hypothetical protein